MFMELCNEPQMCRISVKTFLLITYLPDYFVMKRYRCKKQLKVARVFCMVVFVAILGRM